MPILNADFSERNGDQLAQMVADLNEPNRYMNVDDQYGRPVPGLVIHKTPSGGELLSYRGRVFAINTKMPGFYRGWYGRLNYTSLPTWALNLVSDERFKVHFLDASGVSIRKFVYEPWNEEVEHSIQWYGQQGGHDYAMEHWPDLKITVMDSYAAGNCIPGTRQLINHHFGGNPTVTLQDLIRVGHFVPHWEMDILRVAAWAACTSPAYESTFRPYREPDTTPLL